MGILPLKKCVNRDKCSFATKQRMFGVFAIDEILRYRGTGFPGSCTLCHPGLRLSGEAEIDLVLAFVSGVFLHVVIFEVKRADTYPWSTSRAAPSRQAVNKAELQLTKDVDIMMDILAGTPPGQVVIRTLACFPDVSSSDLQTMLYPSCLQTVIVC